MVIAETGATHATVLFTRWLSMADSTSPNSGFTLVELSIVLIIIGLLIGGILVGKDLIRVAELRGFISQVDKIKTAIQTFRLKYNCLPGDCLTATSYFSGVVNGNGDGHIDGLYNSPFSCVAGGKVERYQIWLHLADAGLFPGNYTGASGPGDVCYDLVPGVNIPLVQGLIANAGIDLAYAAGDSGVGPGLNSSGGWNTSVYGNVFYFHGVSPFAVYTVPDTYWIDTKIDDGKPGTGNMFVPYQNNIGGHSCFWITTTFWDLPTLYYLLNDPLARCTFVLQYDH